MQVPPAEPSDAEVIAAVLGGATAQFAVLVRRYNQVLFRACRAVLHDDVEAEDAVQVTWVNVYRALATFRADARFRTWITRIAVNQAAAHARKRRRLNMVPLEGTPMNATNDPERDAADQELGRLLEREIDALPEGMRLVLVLRDVMEMDTAETAQCLGIGEEAVRVRLHRARHAVADALDGAGDAEGLARAEAAVWRFDGARCARMLERVMAEISRGWSTWS